jgi:hypothetical protein
MIASELAATGSRSTRRFHTFDFGKIEQRGAEGCRSASAGLPPTRSAMTITARRATLTRLVSAVMAESPSPVLVSP